METNFKRRSFNYRRNEFLKNLREDLIQKRRSLSENNRSSQDHDDAKSNREEIFLPKIDTKSRRYSRYYLNGNSLQSSLTNSFNLKRDSNSNPFIGDFNFKMNLKYFVGNRNLTNVKALFEMRDLKKMSIIGDSSMIANLIEIETNNQLCIQDRFKKRVKILFIILKLINMHKISMEKIQVFGDELKVNNIADNYFDKNYYARPKEPPLPDEAKKILSLDPQDRTKYMIRYLMISLNLSVPEFSEFPINIQKLYAQFAYYQEFEPNRVIVRQGHHPTYYYMIISGLGLVIEASNTNSEDLVYTPMNMLKRGDSFGELAIINNTKRTASVRVHGNKPLCMLCVDKDDFYRIQGGKNLIDKLNFLRTSVPFLNKIEYPFDLLEKENTKSHVCFSIYYRKGAIICDDSQKDDWLYVIKSGSCQLVKKLKFDEKAFDMYLKKQKSNQDKIFKRLQVLLNLEPKSTYFTRDQKLKFMEEIRIENSKRFEFKNHENKYVYLELSKLNAGDVFGLNDLVFNYEDDCKCSLMLISEGIECVLLHRYFFSKYLTPQKMFQLKRLVPNYPDDEYFVEKYFNSFIWNEFKSESQREILQSLEFKKNSPV